MTTATLQQHIGATYRWAFRGLSFDVRCVDARVSYGKVQLFIVPVSGSGQCWVDLTSLAPAASEPRL